MNKYPEPETLFWLDDDHDIIFQVKEYEDGRQRVYHFNNIDLIWCGSWNLHESIDENPNWSYLTKEGVLETARNGRKVSETLAWIIANQNTFATAWVLGVWYIKETGKIVKLKAELEGWANNED